MTETEAFAAALRLLSVRDRSEAEIRERLSRRGFTEPAVEAAIERCRGYGYIDDCRFARERARALLRNGRGIGPRILHDLKSRGVEEGIAREALDEVSGDVDEGELLQELSDRRFPGFDYATATARERQRVLNYFMRRGFSLSRLISFFRDR